ncbi:MULTISPECIES: hypothetical protein [unclassified Pseudomonas]|uniref:hypothetical protein n=1 Tax=unclassified Pseudomonas TaxID=196821 RepID=UPI0008775333|nr:MULTISPECIES: hypothetical protein [unclassified Pseudomonas]SCX72438.1 hypothetical protein SAMN03159507_05180 [Pseudomonas sp. NFACC32-1]SFY28902.1 hypothetical protein SAMN03159442_05161 [Pseudomonas sp. NFACC47-1]SFY42675.1 hypothetical protein SAMN03159352_05210 [Pseudomonas sp. NFACC43]
MKLSRPKKMFDMDSFLPLDGEDKVDMVYSGGDLSLEIFYESESCAGGLAKKNIRFLNAKYFFKAPFPGYSIFVCPDDGDISLLNSLVEYELSELLDIDGKTRGVADYRHYRLFLHSVGVALHVIAKSFKISNEG